MKILHILDHYKPHFSGYVFRSSYILKHQRELGLEPVVVTSPKQGQVKMLIEKIDDMRIYRIAETEFGDTPFFREKRLMAALEKRIEEAVEEERPDVIHAHSPSLNGMPALKVAQRRGVPFCYEIRAFWEDAAVDHGTFAEKSMKYRVSRLAETRLMKKADALFTICEGLRGDMAKRGIPADKVTVINNCVDRSNFSPVPYDSELAEKLGVKGTTVFGFIGSFYYYEGLDLLLDAFAAASQSLPAARLLLVGDGPARPQILEKAESLGLGEKVLIPGKVPHEEVKGYYSIIGFQVYPRKSMRLTELVTPLKPLETMAMGKIVVGSDVGGIKELVTHGHDGFLFPAGNVQALAELMVDLAEGKHDLERIVENGMQTVAEKHDWHATVQRYLPVYERLVKKAKAV